MSFDNAYEAITEENDDGHWAFGTGFDDPLSGVDRALPSHVDSADLAAYCLMLGDDALVLSQRLTEWCSRAPELEEDVALANIALDLLGQARLLLARAGEVEGAGRDEDALAYLRDEHEFRNVRLVEVDCGPGPGGDFATTIARLLVFSSWRLAVLRAAGVVGGPGAGRDRREGREGAGLPPRPRRAVDAAARGRHRVLAGADDRGPGDGVAAGAGAVRHARGRGAARPASRSTRPPCGPRWTRCWTGCSPRPGSSGRTCPRWPRSRGAAAGTACTPRRWATCSRRCSTWPGRCRERCGERPGDRRVGAGPGAAGADAGRPRGAAVGARSAPAGWSSRSRRPTPAARRSRRCARTCGSGWARPGTRDVEVRTVLHPAWTTDWISEAGRRKLAEHGIAPPARVGPRSGPIPLRLDAAGHPGALPPVRVGGHDRAVPVLRDRVQGAAPLRVVPGAVRARQGDLSGRDLPPAARGPRRPAVRGRGRGDVRGAARAAQGVRVQAGAVPDAAPGPGRRRGAALVLDLRAAVRAAPDRGARGSTAGCSRRGWSTSCDRATCSTCCRRWAASRRT